MQSTAGELEQKTQNYWRVSSIWNRRLDDNLNVGDAITEVMDTMRTNPSRPIFHATSKLMEELIEGESRLATESSTVLTFPDAVDLVAALTSN